MSKLRMPNFVLICAMLSAGCQSASVVAVPPTCPPPPMPETWIMRAVEPTLTRETLRLFSPLLEGEMMRSDN